MWWFSKGSFPLPEASGPFTPGCTDVMLDYSQSGLFMRLYYPTDGDKTDPNRCNRWIPWFPGDGYIVGFAKVIMSFTFLVRLVHWWSPGVIPAVYGSRPKVDQKLKCFVFSHGLGAHRALYSNMCCELASRGYLVAALEHRDGSACHTFYYKSKEDAQNKIRTSVEYEPFRLGLGKVHHAQRHRQVNYRAEECGKVVDFLTELNAGNVPHNVFDDVPTRRQVDFKLEDFVGKLDLETLTMCGHSFGGGTALLALSKRQEFKQAILLDPWMYPIKDEGLHEKITQPLVFINTQTFHIKVNVEAMSKFLANDQTTMYTILHTTHESQSDTTLLVGHWMNWFMKKLEPLVALKINSSIILDFLDKCGCSSSDIEDCRRYLEEQKDNVAAGLTKPWA